jgi:hypothetical protein
MQAAYTGAQQDIDALASLQPADKQQYRLAQEGFARSAGEALGGGATALVAMKILLSGNPSVSNSCAPRRL